VNLICVKTYFFSTLTAIGFVYSLSAQSQETDSLRQLLNTQLEDSTRINVLMDLAYTYYFSKPDSCLLYAEEALSLARKLRRTNDLIEALNCAGEALRFLGDYPRSLEMQMEALELNRKMKDINGEAITLSFIGFSYSEFREYRLGIQYLRPARELSRKSSDQLMETFALTGLGHAYDLLKMPDSALYYQRLALNTYPQLRHGPMKSLILTRYGNAFSSLGVKDSALFYYHKALRNAIATDDKVNDSKIQAKIAGLYESSGDYDSSLYYARQSVKNGQQSAQPLQVLEASNLLVKLFRQTKHADSAFFYLDLATRMADQLYGPQKVKELQLLMLEEQKRQQDAIREQEQFKNRIKYISVLSAAGVLSMLAVILLINNRRKQKANNLLNLQKNKIEETLAALKSAQAQLIQSEKMASLGELTAGIAHEIQNPMNFVNNFSEVNKELLIEMKDEMEKGNMDTARVLANDAITNQEKINHHGKRADAIIKGMLQHSRSGSGVKEPTDINALADEYLRLAYHGLRAKDKSFNALMETNFDETIGAVNIIPQDIGRAVLNLITNAFYAVSDKKKKQPEGQTSYHPTVTIITKRTGDKVLISVKDNGNGIPQKVIDKIFQPFFTTKPTGEGTGLGLSLSYDIVKTHGGEIKVNTNENEGTEFTITLPA
jgi:two-component system, NtrC family, sensor kinase